MLTNKLSYGLWSDVMVWQLSFVPGRRSCSRQQWVDIQYIDTGYLKNDIVC